VSESETFLSRWLRLKRESAASLPAADAPAPVAFDPASLPPIESIVADSDIKQFMQEDVPAELTRAALRSAWTADPAIRDFVGIAENQWNFNDHACIPGFGPLEAADYLAARVLGSLTNVAQETPQGAQGAEPSALPGNKPLEAVRPAAAPPSIGKTSGVVAAAVTATAGLEGRGGAETGSAAAVRRTHGGALPQ
jgi:Protein of unknown function (DUF3306)